MKALARVAFSERTSNYCISKYQLFVLTLVFRCLDQGPLARQASETQQDNQENEEKEAPDVDVVCAV